MQAPQIILIVLASIDVIVHAALHETPRGNYNVFIQIIDKAILMALLIWGGFFS